LDALLRLAFAAPTPIGLSLHVRPSRFTAMGVSWAFGFYLDADFDRYPILLWTMAGAALVSVLCHLAVPSEPLRATANKRHHFLESVRLSKQDRVFVQLLAASMVLGMGVLSANALRVDYLANPQHGLGYDVKTVSLITGIIPSLVRLISTFFWGWLFDHMNFFRLRIIVNLVFLVGLVLYFLWPDMRLIVIGSALFGLARGGGEILFNLFVTKIAPSELIADYMSVHTFLAGIRILAAPFLGFLLAQYVSISVMTAVSASLMLLSIFVVGKASRASFSKGTIS
ncbi:MAG: MFS transporter, partial [Verrucomicrobiota bacterium]